MARQLVRSLLGDTPLSDLTVRVPTRRTDKILAAMPRKTNRMMSQSIESLSGSGVRARNLSNDSYQTASR
jgi:hypothetical protein